MNNKFKVFEEAFEEATEETVKNHKKELILLGVGILGFAAGMLVGKKSGAKVAASLLEATKQQARTNYADELLREAMRYSVQGVVR